jgi:isocitrate/isopropylmalate dehydrogenase
MSLMLNYLNERKKATIVKESVEEVILEGKSLTPDLGGKSSTQEMAKAIANKIRAKE